MAIDFRIVQLGIELDNKIAYYSDLNIEATGVKFSNENDNTAEIKISNLDKPTRDYLLSLTSPFLKNKKIKKVYLSAGRESYGLAQIYVGDIISASISQPPDLTLTLKCSTAANLKGNVVVRNSPKITSHKTIAQGVANDLGVALVYQATDTQVSNYSFIGGATKQVNKLAATNNVNAYIDDNKLIVKDMGVPLANKVKVLNLSSGMIGQPEITEHGVKVTYLIDNDTTLGGTLRVQSLLNPSINGDYHIYKLSFHITNRNTQFYYIAECQRLGESFTKSDWKKQASKEKTTKK